MIFFKIKKRKPKALLTVSVDSQQMSPKNSPDTTHNPKERKKIKKTNTSRVTEYP